MHGIRRQDPSLRSRSPWSIDVTVAAIPAGVLGSGGSQTMSVRARLFA